MVSRAEVEDNKERRVPSRRSQARFRELLCFTRWVCWQLQYLTQDDRHLYVQGCRRDMMNCGSCRVWCPPSALPRFVQHQKHVLAQASFGQLCPWKPVSNPASTYRGLESGTLPPPSSICSGDAFIGWPVTDSRFWHALLGRFWSWYLDFCMASKGDCLDTTVAGGFQMNRRAVARLLGGRYRAEKQALLVEEKKLSTDGDAST